MVKRKQEFQLAFPARQIRSYAERYSYRPEDEAREAGERVRQGDYSKENLFRIIKWKTKGRGKSRFEKNTPKKVEAILRAALNAVSEQDDRCAVQILTQLCGVGVPVASAILTFIDPHFTIIDFRALEALGYKRRGQPSLALYTRYLDYCRQFTKENGIDLRQLDKALWSFSRSHNPNC